MMIQNVHEVNRERTPIFQQRLAYVTRPDIMVSLHYTLYFQISIQNYFLKVLKQIFLLKFRHEWLNGSSNANYFLYYLIRMSRCSKGKQYSARSVRRIECAKLLKNFSPKFISPPYYLSCRIP